MHDAPRLLRRDSAWRSYTEKSDSSCQEVIGSPLLFIIIKNPISYQRLKLGGAFLQPPVAGAVACINGEFRPRPAPPINA